MDRKAIVEKIKKLQANAENVQLGGKGTPRRKKKIVFKTAAADDKKVQSNLKKLSVTNIPGIEEVNMIKDDGTVIHFNNPKVQASVPANTFSITGAGENKQITDMLPGILNQLGPESLTHLKKLANNVTSQFKPAPADDDVPVMRLSRPKFAEVTPFPADPADPTGFSQLIDSALCSRDGERRHDFPVGEYLMAPQMFENIYLGETFTFYVNCVNESDQKVTDVSVKCELQTNSQRVSLSSNIHDVVLEAKGCSGQIISHEVKEIGQHILICSVNYKTSSDEKMYFRKFFKFPVGKPIDVKTKFYNAEVNFAILLALGQTKALVMLRMEPFKYNDVYLEAQIENTAATGMVLEKVDLEPSSNYTASAIAPCDGDELTGMYLKPRDIRQFLFCLTPKDVHGVVYKDLTNIGKLDMSWRTSMGERGRLQTSPLQRIAPTHGDVRLSVENLPATVPCGDTPVFHRIPSELLLPRCVSLCLFIFFIFQSISGIRIVDSFLKKTYEHDDIAQVFVM
ncbi:unnamed protein product [Nippostrongylus brasiliensis]|uniref:Transcription factor BTF3 n=1 Tax=Nippostrongylus brasiliensis TaxID=27835 RepID=A0A158QZJ8_NIPBR|nr:unnamed protein product [Nippostrongylus brasiliensis]